MNRRIKEVRKILNLSQEAFGAKINLTRGAISLLEAGTRNVTERTINDICRVFKVNENWLRNGEGEIFNNQQSDIFENFAVEYNLDDMDKRIISAYLQLNNENKNAFKNILQLLSQDNFYEEYSTDNNIDSLKIIDASIPKDAEIEKKVKDYRLELYLEKDGQMSSALQDINYKGRKKANN